VKRTIVWLSVLCVLLAILTVVSYLGPAIPGSAAPTPAREVAPNSGAERSTPPERPVPVPSIGVPSGVATAIPSEPATPTAVAPKVTPAPTPIVRILPPVVVAKGVVTWQPGAGLWASPGAIVRGWGVHQGELLTVCAGSHCIRVAVRGWCACGDRSGLPTLLDLSAAAFARLASLSAGVLRVEVGRP
jgi:hypothetical protein